MKKFMLLVAGVLLIAGCALPASHSTLTISGSAEALADENVEPELTVQVSYKLELASR